MDAEDQWGLSFCRGAAAQNLSRKLGENQFLSVGSRIWLQACDRRWCELLGPSYMKMGFLTRATLCKQGKVINQPAATKSLQLGQPLGQQIISTVSQ